ETLFAFRDGLDRLPLLLGDGLVRDALRMDLRPANPVPRGCRGDAQAIYHRRITWLPRLDACRARAERSNGCFIAAFGVCCYRPVQFQLLGSDTNTGRRGGLWPVDWNPECLRKFGRRCFAVCDRLSGQPQRLVFTAFRHSVPDASVGSGQLLPSSARRKAGLTSAGLKTGERRLTGAALYDTNIRIVYGMCPEKGV